jgi:hypothetical protein
VYNSEIKMTKERKTKLIVFRVPPSLYRRIAAAARMDQREISDWLRLRVVAAVEKPK